MHQLNIFVAGQKFFGQEVLKTLMAMEGIHIAGVSAPAHTDKKPDRLWHLAGREKLRRVPAGSLNAAALPDGIDLIVAAHCHDYISPKTIRKTKLGAIGYHPSLLPRHRGRDAVYWTIHTGEAVTGGTVYWLSDKVDGGPIAAQRFCHIRPGEGPFELWARALQPLGIALIQKTVLDIQKGLIVAVPQDESLATWEPSFGRPPLFRPDLPLIGPAPEGFKVVVNQMV